MAILGITNRTENWKTAAYFAPLFGHGSVRLARRLLGADADLDPGDVRLELFWCGVRDYIYQNPDATSDWTATFAERYEHLFPELRRKVAAFRGFRTLATHNYRPTAAGKLASNLRNTEIDIVLESPRHLFIGEAKHEMTFGASSRDVLTHQLMRQYVTARILVDLLGQQKEVVPFVVGNSRADLNKQNQVRFMKKHFGLREENVLEWEDIEALW